MAESMAVSKCGNVFLENEAEANKYAARCLTACAAVGAAAWLLNILGIFIVPGMIMNIAMPVMIFFYLFPTLICKLTEGKGRWVKYAVLFCGTVGVFILSAAMPKHGVLAWLLPLMLSSHYYSIGFTRLTLVVSQLLLSASIYIGMYFGEWDQILLNAPYYVGERVIDGKLLLDNTLFIIVPRAGILLGLSVICTTLAKRTRSLLEKQAKDSEERQRIETELDVAKRIQADMLPCIFPAFPGRQEFEVYATMNPAKEVGGDFYDFFMVDERHLAIVVADVSGKGVPAALFMVIGKTLIKDHTKPGTGLGEVFAEVNDLLCESNSEGLFITAFEGVLDLVTGEFSFVNAGHEIPFISRGGMAYEPHKIRPGFVLAGMEGMKYEVGHFSLEPGEKIFQDTDGVTEAQNKGEMLYGMERLTRVLSACGDKPPAKLLAAVKEDIDGFVGEAPQFDDITMLCLEYRERMAPAKE